MNKKIERIADALKSVTTEKFSTENDIIEFNNFPLVIDTCPVTGKVYLHDYGFGDGPEGITDYFIGKRPADLLKRVTDAIKDVKHRMELEKTASTI